MDIYNKTMSYSSFITYAYTNFTIPSIQANDVAVATFAVQGVEIGDFVVVSCSIDQQQLIINGYVDAVNNVTVTFHNHKAVMASLGVCNLNIRIYKL